ncbi:hypothetical protein D3C73_1506000 [compost metagenome]
MERTIEQAVSPGGVRRGVISEFRECTQEIARASNLAPCSCSDIAQRFRRRHTAYLRARDRRGHEVAGEVVVPLRNRDAHLVHDGPVEL